MPNNTKKTMIKVKTIKLNLLMNVQMLMLSLTLIRGITLKITQNIMKLSTGCIKIKHKKQRKFTNHKNINYNYY
jgi:hypothetical protein